MKLNPKYIQLVGDAVIPLLGFFAWNWGLYFIVIFYLIDLFANEILVHFQSKKVVDFKELPKTHWIKHGGISFLIFVGLIVLIHLSLIQITPSISFYKEFISFLTYEDMGIQQGIILIPLIAIVTFQRYKMEFILPKVFERKSIVELWKPHLNAKLAGMAFVGIAFLVAKNFAFSQLVYVIGIIVVSTIYQLIMLRRIN